MKASCIRRAKHMRGINPSICRSSHPSIQPSIESHAMTVMHPIASFPVAPRHALRRHVQMYKCTHVHMYTCTHACRRFLTLFLNGQSPVCADWGPTPLFSLPRPASCPCENPTLAPSVPQTAQPATRHDAAFQTGQTGHVHKSAARLARQNLSSIIAGPASSSLFLFSSNSFSHHFFFYFFFPPLTQTTPWLHR